MSHNAPGANANAGQEGAPRGRGRPTRGGTPNPQGRTTSMVPGRAQTARSVTPQPTAGRMQFRPVIPQRRRTPGAGSQPASRESSATPQPASTAAQPARPHPRQPKEMTASGPFALGPTDKPGGLSRAAAAQRPVMTVSASAPKSKPMHASGSVGEDEDEVSIDIHDVQQLDDAAPQALLQPPPRFKREKTEIKSEAEEMQDVPAEPAESGDINQSQALDLSESEEEEGEDELAGRFVSSVQLGESNGNTFLFQFPRPFPTFRATPEPVTKPDADAEDVVPVETPAPPPTQGQAGRLQIYHSGRAVLYLGDIPYEITSGCETSFLQQVMLLDADQQRALCFGELNAKMVATPDLSYLLDHAHE